MALRLGDPAPDFSADSTDGPIDFHQWAGDHWIMLFSHPADFTPVCTTELGAFARRKPEFDARDTQLLGVSVDPVSQHKAWAKDIEETQACTLNFPILDGSDHKVPELYDMIHPNADTSATVRTVFIIDPNKKIRLTLTYPASAGRNVDELLRVIDSLQLTDNHNVATPVDWKDGDDVIIVPTLSDEEAKKQFPAGWDEEKPYLRVTKQPPQ